MKVKRDSYAVREAEAKKRKQAKSRAVTHAAVVLDNLCLRGITGGWLNDRRRR